jgi:hypothetical protein
MTGQQGNSPPEGNVVSEWWTSVLDRFRRPKEPLSVTTPATSVPTRALPKVEVRRVRRVLRRIDPWTVLKAGLIFNVIGGLVFVLGMWVTWSISLQRGIPDGIASIFEALTLTYTPDGELYFRALLLLTIVGVVVATAAMTLGAVVYNLISDLVGGVEFTVLEETFQPQSQMMLRPGVPVRRPVPPVAPATPQPVPTTQQPTQPAPAGSASTVGTRVP